MINNIDPWELLREARESVQLLANKLHNELDYGYSEEQEQLCSRIDTALTAHEAEMIEHRKNFARDCKDFDRTMAAWKNG